VKEKSIAAMNKYGLQSVVAPEKVEASCSIIMHQRIISFILKSFMRCGGE
jgi:hypothetical protein